MRILTKVWSYRAPCVVMVLGLGLAKCVGAYCRFGKEMGVHIRVNIQEREISSPPPSFPDAVLGGAVALFFSGLGLAD